MSVSLGLCIDTCDCNPTVSAHQPVCHILQASLPPSGVVEDAIPSPLFNCMFSQAAHGNGEENHHLVFCLSIVLVLGIRQLNRGHWKLPYFILSQTTGLSCSAWSTLTTSGYLGFQTGSLSHPYLEMHGIELATACMQRNCSTIKLAPLPVTLKHATVPCEAITSKGNYSGTSG